MTDEHHPERPVRLRGGEGGTSLVEFAFVMTLLFTLIFGIIHFGVLLSFQQDLTRSAAEGARAGKAVAYPSSDALSDATAATTQSIDAIGKQCNANGMVCDVQRHDCVDAVPDALLEASKDDCIRVRITYDYRHHPLLVPPPLISGFLPDTLTATSDARTNT